MISCILAAAMPGYLILDVLFHSMVVDKWWPAGFVMGSHSDGLMECPEIEAIAMGSDKKGSKACTQAFPEKTEDF